MTLREKIEQEIRRRGPLPFSQYVDMCLYDAELGYYMRHAEQFGKAGDFYTSSDVHAVFGRLLARQFDEMWRALGSPEQIEVLELGPGRGLFAQDVLDWSGKKFPDFFRAVHYSLMERSPALRERLETTLSKHFETGKASLCAEVGPALSKIPTLAAENAARMGHPSPSTSPTPSTALRASLAAENAAKMGRPEAWKDVGFQRALSFDVPIIIFANEFFDALPVEVISSQGTLRVDCRDGRMVETWVPASSEELEFLDRYGVHPREGERVEVQLAAQQYAAKLAAAIQSGFLVVIDYGYTRQEQLAGRHLDTIAAYRQHSVSANPYEAPGEQDITAHVNFTALAATAEQNGMTAQPLLTQSQFLMGIGEGNQFADVFEDCRLPQERAKVALQLKHLVTPAGMGENFHVMITSKNIDLEQVNKLSGLSFGRKR